MTRKGSEVRVLYGPHNPSGEREGPARKSTGTGTPDGDGRRNRRKDPNGGNEKPGPDGYRDGQRDTPASRAGRPEAPEPGEPDKTGKTGRAGRTGRGALRNRRNGAEPGPPPRPAPPGRRAEPAGGARAGVAPAGAATVPTPGATG